MKSCRKTFFIENLSIIFLCVYSDSLRIYCVTCACYISWFTSNTNSLYSLRTMFFIDFAITSGS
jgi:hypothetical protein